MEPIGSALRKDFFPALFRGDDMDDNLIDLLGSGVN